MKTLLGYDKKFLEHRTGSHPERPERLTSIVEGLKQSGTWDELVQVTERPDPDVWIRKVHAQEYMDRLQLACKNQLSYIDTPDSAICPESFEVARRAVSVSLAACDMVMEGQADNGFCAVRPPGHHAEFNYSMGFCLFNNIAIAARYLQRQHGLDRILILDWDVHHGNATQHTFERDNTVFYGSIHQHPDTLFPGTGYPEERGIGAGEGFTLNLPLAPGAGDEQCLKLFRKEFLPVGRDFKPDFVLVSAGFDGHKEDPLAQLNLTNEAYKEMTREIMKLAGECCGGRLLSFLEGGYNLEVLGRCVGEHLNLLRQ